MGIKFSTNVLTHKILISVPTILLTITTKKFSTQCKLDNGGGLVGVNTLILNLIINSSILFNFLNSFYDIKKVKIYFYAFKKCVLYNKNYHLFDYHKLKHGNTDLFLMKARNDIPNLSETA